MRNDVQPVRCGNVLCRVRYLYGREVTNAEVDAFAHHGARGNDVLPLYMPRLPNEVLHTRPTADTKPREYTLTEKWPGAGKRAPRRVAAAGDKKRKEEVAAGDKKRKEEPPAEEESNKRQDRGDAPVDQLDYF